MNRIDLLSNLVDCSMNDDDKSIEHIFGKIIHEYKPLYIFYDIIKEYKFSVYKFKSPLIEGDEITFRFNVKKKIKGFGKLNKMIFTYKNSKTDFLCQTHNYKDGNYALTLIKILK